MRFFSFFFIFIAAGLAACSGKKEPAKATTPPPPLVDVIIAGKQSVTQTVEVNGTVVASEFVEIKPEISGRLTYLNIPEGRNISKGTLLARINDAEMQAQHKKLQVQLAMAEKTAERTRKLLEIQGINEADYDLAVNQVNTIKADMDILKAQIEKTFIRAPFSGVLGLRQISNGAFVTSSNTIATLQQVNVVKVDFTIPETYSSSVKTGNMVDVILDKSTTLKRRARIVAIEPQINESTRNLLVRATLETAGVNPGSFAKVIINSSGDGVILIPSNAVIPEAKAKKVIVVKGGNAIMTNITTGIRREGNLEVLTGLNIGDSVVVTGVLFAKNNKPVKVRSVKQLNEVSQ